MSRIIRALAVVWGAIAAIAMPAVAQDGKSELERILEQFSGENARGYVQPLADLFGANMNSGWFRSAYVPESGLHLSVELVGMGSRVDDDARTYVATTPPGFEPQTFSTATIFGGPGTVVSDEGNPALRYAGSDGIVEANWFPGITPQLRVGSVAGTELIGRFATTVGIDSEEVPGITLWGVGGRHSISQYLPDAPLDLSIGVMYTRFTAAELVDFNGLIAGAQAGKRLGEFEVYGGAGWERSRMRLSYASTDPANPGSVELNLDGTSGVRMTLGGAINVGFLHAFGDVNVGSAVNVAVGLALGS